jgi:hypothetical protein
MTRGRVNPATNLATGAGYFTVPFMGRESGKESGNGCRIPRSQARPWAYPAMNPATMTGFRPAVFPRMETPR